MIRIDYLATANLNDLAVEHYNDLIGVPLVNGIDYHTTQSLIGRIRTRRRIDLAQNENIKVAFWDYLLANDFVNLKRVVTSRPDVLKTIITEIDAICGRGFFSNNIDYNSATLTPFGDVVKAVFNYKSYRKSQKCASNCEKFNLPFCPYCNSIETQVITTTDGMTGEDEQTALLQLDHFYPQSRHPYFSVSFFNLIPGCSPCNAQLKKEKRFDIDTHFNPFQKDFDDFFQFELTDLLLNQEADVQIAFSNKQPYVSNQIDDFEVIKRYNGRRRLVYRMFNSFKYHSPRVSHSIGQQIPELYIVDASTTHLLLENYDVPVNRHEINQVSLGKLKRDIAIQMGIL